MRHFPLLSLVVDVRFVHSTNPHASGADKALVDVVGQTVELDRRLLVPLLRRNSAVNALAGLSHLPFSFQ